MVSKHFPATYLSTHIYKTIHDKPFLTKKVWILRWKIDFTDSSDSLDIKPVGKGWDHLKIWEPSNKIELSKGSNKQ